MLIFNKGTYCEDELKELIGWEREKDEATALAMPGQNSYDRVTGNIKKRWSLKRQIIIIQSTRTDGYTINQ